MLILLFFVRRVLWPKFQLRATLLLRDAWLGWTGLASATLKSRRWVGVARVAVAVVLAYLGIP
jgi:hypothetical protein